MANVKFSEFAVRTTVPTVDYIVGYQGADNIQIEPTDFLGDYLPLAGGTMIGNTTNIPGAEVRFGSSNEMGLFYSSGTSNIRINSGTLAIRADDLTLTNSANTEYYMKGIADGAVELYYDNVKKFETEASGVLITSGSYCSWGTSGVTSIEGSTVSNKIAFRTLSTERMRIDSLGNIGIGTATPDTKLHIEGGSAVTGAFYDGSTVLTIEDVNPYVQIIGNDGGNQASSLILTTVPVAGTGNNKNWALQHRGTTQSGNFGISYDVTTASGQDGADGTDLFVIETGGNVGIGTITPDSVLNIKAEDPTLSIESNRTTVVASEILGQIDFVTNEGSFATNPATSARIRVDESEFAATTMSFWTSTNPADVLVQQLTIDPSGDVGIGVSDPDSKLEIKGDGAAAGLTFKTTDSSGNTGFWVKDGGAVGVHYAPFVVGLDHSDVPPASTSVYVNPSVGSDDGFFIKSDGDVGIGITAPLFKLHTYRNDANATPSVTIENDGTGDASIHFLLSGIVGWSAGLDNSDGDAFKIHNSQGFANSFLTITTDGLNKVNSSSSGDHNAFHKTGTYTKTSTGSTTAMDIVKVGHTHAVNYTVVAKVDTSNQGVLVGNTSTAYGSNAGIIVDSEAYAGVISDIAVAYDNSFYGFTVAVTYTGVTHPIIYMAVTGQSSEDFLQQ